MRGRRCLPRGVVISRTPLEFRSPGLRRNQPEMPHEGHSPNLIEPGFIVCRINSHLSINISCPLLMDN